MYERGKPPVAVTATARASTRARASKFELCKVAGVVLKSTPFEKVFKSAAVSLLMMMLKRACVAHCSLAAAHQLYCSTSTSLGGPCLFTLLQAVLEFVVCCVLLICSVPVSHDRGAGNRPQHHGSWDGLAPNQPSRGWLT
jgi:hypothetical protein